MQFLADRDVPGFPFPSFSAWATQVLRGAGRPWRLDQGAQAARAGDAPSSLVFVERGRLVLNWFDDGGRTAEVGAIDAGGVLGLTEILSAGRHGFDARVDQPVEGWSVPAAAALKAITADPAVMAAAWRQAADDLNAARREIGCILRHGAEARLADRLLRLQDSASGPRLATTHEALGLSLGLNRTTVSELMARLVSSGWVRGGRGWLEVSDRRAIDRLACGCRNVGQVTDATDVNRHLVASNIVKESQE